jgi:diguanylate cyclase (GGDEF)-like protein
LRQSEIVAERIRSAVENRKFVYEEKPMRVTVSVGVVAVPNPSVRDALEFISAADQMLYDAKRGGRNRVCVWRR